MTYRNQWVFSVVSSLIVPNKTRKKDLKFETFVTYDIPLDILLCSGYLSKGEEKMDNNQIKVRVTLELNKNWAKNLSKEQLTEFIKVKFDTALGFRGQVETVKVAQ